MGQLTTSDLRGALALVAGLGEARSLDDLARTVVRDIRRIVPAAVAIYEETDPIRRRIGRRVTDPPRPARGAATCNGVLRMRVNQRPPAAVTLRRPAPFSPRDRAIVRVVQPHVTAAHLHLQAREATSALRAGMLASHQDFLLAATTGQILDTSPGAVDRLRRYLPSRSTEAVVGDIIDPSRRPCRHQDGVQGEVVEGKTGRLAIRVVPGAAPAPCLVLLNELDTGLPAAAFVGLGLTTREVEVARLVAVGRTNTQIATTLVVSTHTVKKHLEHVYTKLGVHTRTELVAVAHQVG